MSHNNESEREKVTIRMDEIDFPKIERVGSKVSMLLEKKLKDPFEAYLLLKLLCFTMEKAYGFQIEPEYEEELKKLLFESPKEE